ncbi:MAG TPA: cytochrome c-type biogenesis CcmF C-terminal domain-containing protein, partial [Sphingopyxis sp.]|nr:cytochrome c-type biogenesis CcmF C-terminal domain-containing protein [Sphingopyxis sp.]
SYWAYYELGWGGWWFWDPVENVSLIPWLAGAALLHSVSVTATRNALRAWTVMLAVIAFSMSMVGTFIVRSGLLTSVHSFAVDPERGTFLLALMFIYIGGALTLFAFRAGAVAEGKKFALLSREGSLVINNLLLTTILALVLLGTLYPIVAEAMGEKISVGPPYYNRVAGPLALILCLVMVTGPLLSWRRDDGKKLWSRLPVAVLAAMIVLFGLVLFGGEVGVLPLLGMTVAGLVAVASLAPLWGRNLRRTPLPTWGMVIAHFGVAVALAGMGAESAFIKERLVAAAPGETVTVADFSVKFAGVKPIAGPNYTAIEGTLIATTPSGASFTLHPAARTFPGLMGGPPTETNEAALLTRPGGQLYAVLGQPVTGPDGTADRYQLRLWWKPLVWWIWLGGALIAIGAALSLLGRSQSAGAFRMRSRWVLFVPLAIMALLFGAFIYRLTVPNDTLIQSQWIDKPMPLFDLPPAAAGIEGLKSSQLADGKPRLVNVFASWCIPCRAEAPQLEALKTAGVPIDGIAIRDRPEDVAQFLRENGNPFERIGSDVQSSVQIALGSSGVPETFLIDGKGIIREQIQGVILADQVPEIVAKLEKMK